MPTLTLRVTQKHAICPPNKKTPFICHDPLSQKSSFAKRKYGLCKNKKIINAKKGHEEKSMLKKQARNNIHAKVQEKKEEKIAHVL
jgi:hypothetical protein